MAYLGPALTALQVLSLSGIERVDDLCMRTIVKHCQDLRDVDVSETSISDKSLLVTRPSPILWFSPRSPLLCPPPSLPFPLPLPFS